MDFEKERENIQLKYANLTFKTFLKYSNEEKEAYNLAWQHAAEFAQELSELGRVEAMANMTSEEFTLFMQKQMGDNL